MTKARKGGKTRRGGNRKRKGGFLAQFQKALAPLALFQVNEMQKKKKKGGRKSRRGGRKSRRGGRKSRRGGRKSRRGGSKRAGIATGAKTIAKMHMTTL
jgi:hypothetical protein